MVPGVVLAALATIGLGLVLGPESPLIAIGSGVAVFIVKRAKRDAPPTLLLVLGAAGAFAAISVVFGSPIMAAIIIIEASGLAGSTLALLLIPGLIAAGIGSLVFIGMASWTGLSTSAYSLAPLPLAALGNPTFGEIGWTILLGARRRGPHRCRAASSVCGWLVRCRGVRSPSSPSSGSSSPARRSSSPRSPTRRRTSSCSPGRTPSIRSSPTPGRSRSRRSSCSSCARASPGASRSGRSEVARRFPAMFIGAAGGLAASHLPGLPMSAAVPVAMGAMLVSFLRLPLSAIVIASLLCASAGTGVAPLVIVGVVVAYLMTLALEGRLGSAKPEPPPAAAGSVS